MSRELKSLFSITTERHDHMTSRFEMIPLCSGSSGNSILVRVEGLQLLFDLGISCKRITEALVKVGTDPNDIDAVFLSHAHSDHIAGADVFMRKYNKDVYATDDTMRGFLYTCKKEHDPSLDHIIDDEVSFGNVTVKACRTPHDTAGSVCFKVCCEDKAVMIMTDLGHVTDEIRDMALGVDGILIESNYDLEMLLTGPYDYVLKRRVEGPYGHLSNVDCAKMIKELIDSGTRNFMLGHLSENNNVPEVALGTVVDYLMGFGLMLEKDYHLTVAKRYEPSSPMVVFQ